LSNRNFCPVNRRTCSTCSGKQKCWRWSVWHAYPAKQWSTYAEVVKENHVVTAESIE